MEELSYLLNTTLFQSRTENYTFKADRILSQGGGYQSLVVTGRMIPMTSITEVETVVVKKRRSFIDGPLDTNQEIKILKDLQGKHPNVVTQIFGCVYANHVFSVLEKVGDEDLFTVANRIGRDSLKYLPGIVDGVLYLHKSASLVHLDLALENVVISSSDQPVIIDFDMSKPIGTLMPAFERGRHGKQGYAAPELYDSANLANVDMDAWSLGFILYALYTSRFPFGDSVPSDSFYVRMCRRGSSSVLCKDALHHCSRGPGYQLFTDCVSSLLSLQDRKTVEDMEATLKSLVLVEREGL